MHSIATISYDDSLAGSLEGSSSPNLKLKSPLVLAGDKLLGKCGSSFLVCFPLAYNAIPLKYEMLSSASFCAC